MSETIKNLYPVPKAMKEICRMCLKTNANFVSLDSTFESSTCKSTYWDAYTFCTNLKALPTDSLPQVVCLECTEKLKIVFEIIRKAMHSNQELRHMLIKEIENYSEAEIEILDEEADFIHISENRIESNPIEEYVSMEEPSKHWNDEDTTLPEYACGVCEQSFSSKKDVIQHIITHVNTVYKNDESKQLPPKENIVKKPPENMFLCEYCAKPFTTKQKLKMHIFVHTKQKNFPCHLCPKRFTTVFKQREHLRSHTGIRNHACQVCDRRFLSKRTLVCHMRTHTGDRPFKCNLCDKSFYQSAILRTHIALHEGKLFECPNCRKKFCSKSQMELHMSCHMGERRYKCYLCSKTYKQKCHLDGHIGTHLGVKFTCEICQKQYTKKGSLKSHMYTHSKDRPHKCEICSKDFQSKDR